MNEIYTATLILRNHCEADKDPKVRSLRVRVGPQVDPVLSQVSVVHNRPTPFSFRLILIFSSHLRIGIWLRHYTTSRKAAGSNPGCGEFFFFQFS
jgi:hypothetical protein